MARMLERKLVDDGGPHIDTFRIPPAGMVGTVVSPSGEELVAKGVTTYQQAPTFREELTRLLNSKSKENESNTPDFVLAEFLIKALEAFNVATNTREDWYGIQCAPGSKNVIMRQPRRG